MAASGQPMSSNAFCPLCTCSPETVHPAEIILCRGMCTSKFLIDAHKQITYLQGINQDRLRVWWDLGPQGVQQ
ncbi:protein of unknown function [Hyphomicrobium sp. 1Nfss2.1]